MKMSWNKEKSHVPCMEVVIEIRTSFIDGGSVYMEKERGVKRCFTERITNTKASRQEKLGSFRKLLVL